MIEEKPQSDIEKVIFIIMACGFIFVMMMMFKFFTDTYSPVIDVYTEQTEILVDITYDNRTYENINNTVRNFDRTDRNLPFIVDRVIEIDNDEFFCIEQKDFKECISMIYWDEYSNIQYSEDAPYRVIFDFSFDPSTVFIINDDKKSNPDIFVIGQAVVKKGLFD